MTTETLQQMKQRHTAMVARARTMFYVPMRDRLEMQNLQEQIAKLESEAKVND